MDEDNELELITEVFGQFMAEEDNGSGEPIMHTDNLTAAMERLGFNTDNQQVMSAILKTLDPDKKGYVEFELFAEVMKLQMEQRQGDSVDMDEVKDLFHLFSGGRDRPIGIKDLQRVSQHVKDNASEQDLLDMLYLSGKSEVDMASFATIMKRANVL